MSSAGSSPALQVENLAKDYTTKKGSFSAVKGVSFTVKSGECVGLLGPNGAGKSTAINCLTGFYPPTSGRVTIFGSDVHAHPKVARQQLGICPQEETLDSDFNCFNQLVRHATFFRIPVSEAKKRATSLLERFGLIEQSNDMVMELSGGMRRRLQVARALISEPKVLVLDEPTTGLDPDARRSLWDVLEDQRKKGLATLLSTHYMDEAERLCDRIILLHHGSVLDEASPRELIQKHVPIQIIEEEIRPGVVWKRPPNLEDVFLKLTGNKLGGGAA